MTEQSIATLAMNKAAEIRRSIGMSGAIPLCIFDLIDRHYSEEIDLRFQPIKSLEGMYSRATLGKSMIVVSTERPGGRRRFTCAHELGHHVFGDSLSLDELVEEQRNEARNPREFQADLFAAFLLMPKLGVLGAARDRGIDLSRPTPSQVFSLAGYFGVGYSTLLTHMARTLGVISVQNAMRLRDVSPQKIRAEVLGFSAPGDAFVADHAWGPHRPIDVIVGDHVVLPRGVAVEGHHLCAVGKTALGDVFQARKPGVSRVDDGSWSAYVRIGKALYRGLSRFRNLPEDDEDE